MSEEAELPQEMPSSAGKRQGAEGGEGGPFSTAAAVAAGVLRLDTPNWKGVSVIWILLGV